MNSTLSPTTCRTGKRRQRRAFTLIEMIVVIGLTAVLFSLLLIPLVNALRYTNQAQSVTAAQDAARVTREVITRELSSALYAFDATSHPFHLANGSKFNPGDDTFTNFLDLPILDSAGAPVIAHAYYAKLDFVRPKVNDQGNPVLDPTTNEPITYRPNQNGSAILSSPSLIFPAAAGTTMTRYWVGLRDPSQDYNNTREGKSNSSRDNTYILYRAQFQLYNNLDPATGKTAKNPDGSTLNEKLFAPKLDAGGNALNLPELDDPDFFRYVKAGDPNWLDETHTAYTAASAGQHNNRVESWRTLAKAVIPGPNVDLILLPHNADGSLMYDPNGTFQGVAHNGVAHDPVSSKNYPIINTSVTFRPATVSGNATPGTTGEYTSAGVPAVAQETGAVYIPTVYSASSRSWAQPYVVTLIPPAASSGQSGGGATYQVAQDAATGDYYEYLLGKDSQGNPTSQAVFDVTTGVNDPNAASYIPLAVNSDSGTINFAIPALLDPKNDRYSRDWIYQPSLVNGQYKADLKQDNGNYRSPLGRIVDAADPQYHDAASNSDQPLFTARIVPGSLRVYGPDAAPGPGQGQPVLYSEVGVGTAAGDNQYTVDYAGSILTFTGNAEQFAPVSQGAPASVKVLYEYQANLAPVGTVDASSSKMTSYTLQPYSVTVDYQTRDMIDVSLGVRIYDLSTGRAQVIPAEAKVKIGNSNR